MAGVEGRPGGSVAECSVTAAVFDLAARRAKPVPPVPVGAYRGQMSDVVPVPDEVPAALAADVLGLPVEILKWISLVGPFIADLDRDTRARVLGEMGNVAGGGAGSGVHVAVGEKVVQVTTTEGGDVNL